MNQVHSQLESNVEAAKSVVSAPAHLVLDITENLVDSVLPEPDGKSPVIERRSSGPVDRAQALAKQIPRRISQGSAIATATVPVLHVASLMDLMGSQLSHYTYDVTNYLQVNVSDPVKKVSLLVAPPSPLQIIVDTAVRASELDTVRWAIAFVSSFVHATQLTRKWLVVCVDLTARRSLDYLSAVASAYLPSRITGLLGYLRFLGAQIYYRTISHPSVTEDELLSDLQALTKAIASEVVEMTPNQLQEFTRNVANKAIKSVGILLSMIKRYTPGPILNQLESLPGYSKLSELYSRFFTSGEIEVLTLSEEAQHETPLATRRTSKIHKDEDRQDIAPKEGEKIAKKEVPAKEKGEEKERQPKVLERHRKEEERESPAQKPKQEAHVKEGKKVKKPIRPSSDAESRILEGELKSVLSSVFASGIIENATSTALEGFQREFEGLMNQRKEAALQEEAERIISEDTRARMLAEVELQSEIQAARELAEGEALLREEAEINKAIEEELETEDLRRRMTQAIADEEEVEEAEIIQMAIAEEEAKVEEEDGAERKALEEVLSERKTEEELIATLEAQNEAAAEIEALQGLERENEAKREEREEVEKLNELVEEMMTKKRMEDAHLVEQQERMTEENEGREEAEIEILEESELEVSLELRSKKQIEFIRDEEGTTMPVDDPVSSNKTKKATTAEVDFKKERVIGS